MDANDPFVNHSETHKKEDNVVNAEFGILGLFMGLFILLAAILLLNYFNIVALSRLFPDRLGFLPHRSIENKNQKSDQAIKKGPVKILPIFSYKDCASITKEENPLLENIKNTDNIMSGTIYGSITDIQLDSSSTAFLKITSPQNNQKATFRLVDQGELIYNTERSKYLTLSNLQKEQNIRLIFTCNAKVGNLFKITNVQVLK